MFPGRFLNRRQLMAAPPARHRKNDRGLALSIAIDRGEVPQPRDGGARPGRTLTPKTGFDHAVGGTTRRMPGGDLGRLIRGVQRTWGVRLSLKLIGNSPSPAKLPEPGQPIQVAGAAPHAPPLAARRGEPPPGPRWRLGAVRGLT